MVTIQGLRARYDEKEAQVGAELMQLHQRMLMLQIVDAQWKDHLYALDHLKEGIGLRAMAQRDPLIEYQREGYQMFQSMMGQIREEAVLTVLATPDAKLGLIFLDVKRAAAAISKVNRFAFITPTPLAPS